ncbi:MAG: hypothetical protein DRQ56_02500 [Gammaproteobacteria bacterium]|nr:MAG: hypothetical protein DRQ56_02500 [Gammaproteobacteria bacterium]
MGSWPRGVSLAQSQEESKAEDADGHTVGTSVSLSWTVFHITGGPSVDVVKDTAGRLDIQATFSLGVAVAPAGLNVGTGPIVSNASNVEKHRGPSVTINKGGYEGPGAEAQTTIGKGYVAETVYLGAGFPGPEIGVTVDYTFSGRDAARAMVRQIDPDTAGSILKGAANIYLRFRGGDD